MTDLRLTAHEWATARHVCTPSQIRVLDLWRRGAGYRRTALVLGIDRSTVREHVKRGLKRIADALEEQAA